MRACARVCVYNIVCVRARVCVYNIVCVNALALSHSYDVIIADGEDSIISKFRDFNAQIVFSAEGFCWPDRSLAVSECVPMVTEWMSCLDLLLICSQSIRKLLLESDSFVLEVRCSPQSFPVPHYPHLSPSHYLHLSLYHTTPTSPCTTLPPPLPHHTTPTSPCTTLPPPHPPSSHYPHHILPHHTTPTSPSSHYPHLSLITLPSPLPLTTSSLTTLPPPLPHHTPPTTSSLITLPPPSPHPPSSHLTTLPLTLLCGVAVKGRSVLQGSLAMVM